MNEEQLKEYFEENLIVGAKIKIGLEYSINHGFEEGEIITLVNGSFEYDNGLYTVIEDAPAVWCETQKDFDSIYHLFGNEFEYFLDCEIL